MKIRTNGLPPYLEQLDEMFAGNTVDGSSSYVPAAGPTTQVHEVTSDDEGADDEDTPTPMSLGTKGQEALAQLQRARTRRPRTRTRGS